MALKIILAAVSLLCICNAYAQVAGPAPAPAPSGPPYVNYQTELDAMTSIIAAWNHSGNISDILSGWSSEDVSPCINGAWQGITCRVDDPTNCTNHAGNNVTCIPLTIIGFAVISTNIIGVLPSAIGNLTNLMYLIIQDNPGLSGPLPKELSKLTQLALMDLDGNSFNGSIPSELGLMSDLLSLMDLSGNQLTGSIPITMGNITYLQKLKLSNNKLSGALPDSDVHDIGLDSLQFLVALNLSNNQLNDTLPHTLGYLKQLASLDLSSNNFTGLSDNLDNLTALQDLYMADNFLSGSFPADLLQLPNLQNMNFDRNKFNGTLDLPAIAVNGSFSKLKIVSMVNNSFSNVTFPDPSTLSVLTAHRLQSSNLLFLGGNPLCKNLQASDNVLRSICRFDVGTIIITVVQGSNRNLIIIITTVVGIFVLLASIISFIIMRRMYKKINVLREIQREFAKNEVQPNLYSYSELKIATQDFHADNKLGEGGFGIVYKGTLKDGTELAVKYLTKSEQVLTEFLNEIVTITGVKHRNLVKLKGCCVNGGQRILVYEFVENKNLAEALWDDPPTTRSFELNWPIRFNIILGIARGLSYLHEEVHPPIIHRDIKAPNILLDKNLDPKIGDFGLALLYPTLDDESTHISVNIVGTKGYLSPEYASFGQVSEKVDVFSFGILLLEIVSGRKNIDFTRPIGQRYILEWAWKLHEDEMLLLFIDPQIREKSTDEDILRVINIGLLCVQYTPSRRPTMSNVISMLQGHKPLDNVFKGSELSLPRDYMDSLCTTIQTNTLSNIEEGKPLLMSMPTTSAIGAIDIELLR